MLSTLIYPMHMLVADEARVPMVGSLAIPRLKIAPDGEEVRQRPAVTTTKPSACSTAPPRKALTGCLRMSAPIATLKIAAAPSHGAIAHGLDELGALRQCRSATLASRLLPKTG